MPLPPDRILFTIPGINWPVYWYGLMVILGTLAAAFVCDREARRRGHNPDHVWNALISVMVFGLIGARLYHVFSSPAGSSTNLQTYLADPKLILGIGQGGLSGLGIYGGILGGIFGLWFYTWLHNDRRLIRALKKPFRRQDEGPDEWLVFAEWADIAALGLPLAQAIGRWGNWFNQELYGLPTKLPWGIPIESQYRSDLFANEPDTTRYHPTFLYESLWSLFVFFLLNYVAHRHGDGLRNGDIALLYCILYPIGRYVIELQRPDAWTVSGIPVAQLISVSVVLVASLWLLWRHDVFRRLGGSTAGA